MKVFGLTFPELILVVTVLTLTIAFILPPVYGQTLPPFGGYITTSFYCTCNNSFLLNVTPPRGGQFLWIPGTPQYAYYSLPRAGVWVLGLYKPGGVCLIYAGDGCVTFGAPKGIITPTVGTSR